MCRLQEYMITCTWQIKSELKQYIRYIFFIVFNNFTLHAEYFWNCFKKSVKYTYKCVHILDE